MESTDSRAAEREAMMPTVQEPNSSTADDDADPPADRRLANWVLAATAGSVPSVAPVM